MSGIDSDLIRGHIDTIILKILFEGDKYGYEICKEVEEKSNGSYELKQPTLYSCLKRLENQGLISSYWEDSDIGGKRRNSCYAFNFLGCVCGDRSQDIFGNSQTADRLLDLMVHIIRPPVSQFRSKLPERSCVIILHSTCVYTDF